jgi:type III pantothenate kinase
MLLAVDVGNTQTAIGLMDAGRVVEHWRIATIRHRTSDEIAGLLAGFFSFQEWQPRGVIDEVAIASVVPRLTSQWVDMSERRLGVTPFVVGPGMRTGMRILLKNPTEVGADRIVNAVAGYERYGAPVIVVDFGTSTNFDVVNQDGDYIGGAIAPGIEVSMEALTTRAAKLVKIDLAEPPNAIGRDTIEAMQVGAVYGFAGQVDGIARAIRGELGVEAKVVATGGLAPLIGRYTTTISDIDPYLTLRGIELMLRRQDPRRR